MKCLKKHVIMAYMDKEIPERKNRKIAAHLARCPVCREAYEKMRQDVDLVMESMDLLNPRVIPTGITVTPKKIEKKSWSKKFFIPVPGWWDWRVALTGSLFIFILGIFVGKYFISPSPRNMLVRLESPEHLHFVLQEHFENIKPVLIEYANFSVSEEGSMDILLDKEFVSGLMKRNRLIKEHIPRDRNTYLKQLLDELEVILREISALTKEKPESLFYIKKMIKEKEILFKLEASNPQSSDLLKI